MNPSANESGEPQKTEDLLKYRPNPDMLVSKTDMTTEVSLYTTDELQRLLFNIKTGMHFL